MISRPTPQRKGRRVVDWFTFAGGMELLKFVFDFSSLRLLLHNKANARSWLTFWKDMYLVFDIRVETLDLIDIDNIDI